ncbi:Verru_Chthon cassette protein A [Phragmitibacter flavus]|uniref:Verru_Chthon cassette protein A n=1 Tax=Phragmitibacter flavus TaxID=2576071 RepID=A0A5R8KG84_9BACT|nr:Verru_Chthon cassette protein A [Phragmitibacter flavus]TLD70965.1 Verru_Chthon cassette protein A [Phragmitibacter flavus]
MKKSNRRAQMGKREKGVALVIVLSCLLLVSGLVLSFFLSISTETKASKLADSGGRSQSLVDTAVNIVMAQIREATSQGSQIAWASQPGMIRTWGDSASNVASSTPRTNYKLYSAERMTWTNTGTAFDPDVDVPPAWSSTPSLFADINQPVLNLQGTKQYPIVDPSSLDLAETERPKGFRIDAPPLATVGPSGAEVNEAPMPVRWLYMLRDGSLTSPTGGGTAGNDGTGGTATWVGSANPPTRENPIVGRLAFWTDDETSKVNINTAAGDRWEPEGTGIYGPEAGSYWAPPHTGTAFDREGLANRSPAQFEYQRYSGHPATTYLSAVIPNLTREQIGQIAPRMQMGGSNGGRVIPTEVVTLDDDRLYASVDELIFTPESGGTTRTMQTGITQAQLDRSRFFLTATSRAPEVSLFNKPRVSMWPVHRNNDATWRTAFDRLIAFCSETANGGKYYFARELSTSPTNDYDNIPRNGEVYNYLRDLMEQNVPGYGGNFLNKYPVPPGGNASDRDQILTSIMDYVRSTNLYDDNLHPGQYPATGQNKQFAGRRGSAGGVGDPGFGQVAPIHAANTNTAGFGRYYSLSEAGLVLIATADGSGDPAEDDNLNKAKIASNVTANRSLGGSLLTSGQKRIEAMFMMELFCPSRGANYIRPSMQIRVTGLENLRINSTIPLGFPADGIVSLNTAASSMFHGRAWGGTAGYRLPLVVGGSQRRIPARGPMAADTGLNDQNVYPFISAPVTVPATGNLRLTSVGPVTVRIYAGHTPTVTDSSIPLQTIQLQFPPILSMPSPELIATGTDTAPNSSAGTPSAEATTRENWWSFSNDGAFSGKPGRLHQASRNPGTSTTNPYAGSIFRQGDIVKTLMPLHGDYRLIAGRKEVPVEVFERHPNYATPGIRMAHTFTETIGSNFVQGGFTTGKLLSLPGVVYSSNTAPDVPTEAGSEAATATGDWDTGIATYTDGPYINKPDEGNGSRNLVNGTPEVPYYDRTEQFAEPGPTFFSPNRQVSSPVMFGSLPTGIQANVPWQTLLFRPHTGTGATHKGVGTATDPPDHLLLDLFWMPVVEPYAVSEPFSTAGKINMNYQMMPFTYIHRSTGLHALFRSERVVAIPNANSTNYKGSAANLPETFRQRINAEETLRQFELRFNNGADVFKSASEICELFLVPEGQTFSAAAMRDFWNNHALTGDNLKERPYSALYPRLTTKSNTYTVHYRVQTLAQAVRSRGTDATAWATWNENTDVVASEIRGSTTLERYIDPLDPSLVDFASPSVGEASLDDYYRFRIISTKRFTP